MSVLLNGQAVETKYGVQRQYIYCEFLELHVIRI